MNTPTTQPTPFTATEVILPGPVEPSGLVIHQRTLSQPLRGLAIVTIEASGISFSEQAMLRAAAKAEGADFAVPQSRSFPTPTLI